jgi:hypothetical protein
VATQFGAVVLPLTNGAVCDAEADVEVAASAGLPKALRAPTVPRLARIAAPAATATAPTQPGREGSRRPVPAGIPVVEPVSVAGGVGVSMTGVVGGVMPLLRWASDEGVNMSSLSVH